MRPFVTSSAAFLRGEVGVTSYCVVGEVSTCGHEKVLDESDWIEYDELVGASYVRE